MTDRIQITIIDLIMILINLYNLFMIFKIHYRKFRCFGKRKYLFYQNDILRVLLIQQIYEQRTGGIRPTRRKGSMARDIHTGNITKHLLLYAGPLIIGDLFQQLYHTVDSVVVQSIPGQGSLAAIGAAGPVMNIL